MNNTLKMISPRTLFVIFSATIVFLSITNVNSAVANHQLRTAITQTELIPNDIVAYQFGYAVAIDGDTAVIGAPAKNNQTGAAYIFIRTAEGWRQQARLLGSDTKIASRFGQSVAISDNTIVIGAPDHNSSGAAYVFVRNGGRWQEQNKLAAPKAYKFGYAVAIRGNTIIIGDPEKKDAAGTAYVFARNGTDWQEPIQLTPSDASANAFFGNAVAITENENTILVGAKGNTPDKIGAAYVFEREGTHWIEQNKLVANPAQQGNKFGTSVAISGNMAVVGATNDAVNEAGETVGATYVFVRDESGWTKQAKLTAHDASVNDKFGISVALSENTLLVGASKTNEAGENTGVTYLFTRRGIAWQSPIKLIANDAHPNDRFGNAVAISGDTAVFGTLSAIESTGSAFVTNVSTLNWFLNLFSPNANEGTAFGAMFGFDIAISGDTLVVGAPFDEPKDEGENNRLSDGAAYVFIRKGTFWQQQAKLTVHGAAGDERFGMSVAISGETIVVGAPNENGTENNMGAAYVFVRNGTTWTQQAKLTPNNISNNYSLVGHKIYVFFGTSVAISGNTVVVSAPGKLNWRAGPILPSSVGSAYVFVREETDWHEQTELKISNMSGNDIDKLNVEEVPTNITDFVKPFGMLIQVAIDGNTIAVGTPLNDNVADDAGLVYIFERTETNWPPTPTYTLTPSHATKNELFGNAVAFNGNTLVVGAIEIDALSTSEAKKPSKVYVFNHEGTAWTERTTLTAADSVSTFGVSVAVSENTLLVGAPFDNLNNTVGAVHEFVYDGTNWVKKPKLTINNADYNYGFGFAVAINGNAKVIGVPFYGTLEKEYQGMVHILPSLTLPSAMSGHYAEPVSVELTCQDCEAIHYTLKGSQPTTASPIYIEPIVLDTTTTLNYFSVGAPAGTETITTQTYVIDTIPPEVSITAPLDGETINRVDEITGNASDEDSGGGTNQLDRVEMLVQDIDTGLYVNLDDNGDFSGFTGTPIWIKATGTTAWQLNTTNIAFITGNTYEVTARAVDLAGNGSDDSDDKTITFTYGERAFTTLSLSLNSHTILQNSPLNVTGKLRRFPSDPDIELSDETIALNITTPEGHTVTQTDGNPYTAKLDQLGNYLIELPSQVFNLKGSYTLQAVYAGSVTLLEAFSENQTVLVGSSAGYAIIVQGKLTNEEGMAAYDKTLNRVYNRLIDRGFRKEDIRYFNYDDTQAGVYSVPNQAAIQSALETWVSEKLNAVPAPLYLIMVDHGSRDTFYLGDETITPTELNQWLNTLESQLNNTAQLEPRSVIIGACYSGSFIPALSKAGRTIITSATAWEVSYKGLKEDDGIRSGEFFIEELFQQLWRGASLKAAFEQTTQRTEMFTRSGHISANKANPFLDDAVQHPLLDDNGDSVGSNVLLTDGDGQKAASIFLGAGLDFQTNANAADIIAVNPTIYLSDSETRALLFLIVNDPDLVDPAIIEIRPPSKILMAQDSTEQIDIDLENRFLEYNAATGRFEIDYNDFTESGRYEIFYTVRDVDSGEISPVQRSVVYKNKPNNSPPNAVALILPANGTKTRTVLVFDWESAVDPDNDPITYNFIIAEDIHFNKIVHQQEELAASLAIVDDRAGLKDLTQYYWKVEAVDSYGAMTSSETFTFTTNNPSTNAGCINKVAKDSVYCTTINDVECKIEGFPEIAKGEGHCAKCLPTKDDSYGLEVSSSDHMSKTVLVKPGTSGQTIYLTPKIVSQPAILQFIKQQPSTVYENEGSLVLHVTRTGRFDNAISVQYETSNGMVSGTLSWGMGDSGNKPITIPIQDDTDFEPDETFKLTLYNPNGATLGALSQIDITIRDNDNRPPQHGKLKFSSNQYRINENAGEVQLSVSRVGGSDGNVSVTYTTYNGSALAGSDYTHTENTLFWADGNDQPQPFSVPIQQDELVEGDEIFVVMLSNPTIYGTLGTPHSVRVTIVDVPPPPPPPVKPGQFVFSTSNESINENGGSITFEVNRIDGSDGEVSVEVEAIIAPDENTATLNSDFHIEGSPKLTWADGDNGPQSITLEIHEDADWEGNEMLVLRLDNPTGGASLGEPQQAQLTIIDNEQPPQPQHYGKLQFSAATQSANEADGTVTIQVTRLDGSDGDISVEVIATAASTATLHSDFSFGTGNPLRWPDGESDAKPLILKLNDDAELESAETIILRLVNATGGASLGEPNQAELTIMDNDKPAGTLQFERFDYYAKSTDASATLIVTREGGDEGKVSVWWGASTGDREQFDWNHGDNQAKKLTLPIPNNVPNNASSVGTNIIILSLYDANGARVGQLSQAVLVIESPIMPKVPGTLQFPFAAESFNEESDEVLIPVLRLGGSQGEVSVDYTISTLEGTATEDMDFFSETGTLTWADGDTNIQTLNLLIMDDEIRENPETFYVTLSNPSNGAQLGTSKQMALTIVDNEPILPSLGNGMAIKKDWQQVPTDTTFTGGITFKGQSFQANVWMPASEPVKIRGEIQVAPEHVGKEADIFMVAAYQPPDYEHELLLMVDTECKILSWDGNLDTLVPVNLKVNLIAKHPINIYKGSLDAGELRIFFAYRLLENGLIVFNGEQAIDGSIQPSQ